MRRVTQHCEWMGCKYLATQADCYQNMWLCDNHYSYLGRISGDYQDSFIDYDDIKSACVFYKKRA